MPIGDLVPMDGNPNQGDIGNLIVMLSERGQHLPLIFHKRNRKRVVIVGNHRLEAARQLGWDCVAAVEFKGTIAEADAFAVGENRSRDRATTDSELMAEWLQRLMAEDERLMMSTGYDADDLDDLILDLNRSEGDLDLDALGKVRTGLTPADRYETWEASGVRSVILPLPVAVYDEALDALAAKRKEYGVDSNSAAVLAMLGIEMP
jgi:ParB-like chromosome segregation protein Spo0J